jgi:putative endonuclease
MAVRERDRRAAERRGHAAEWAAAALLMAKGYRILGRRVKTPRGEIDLIARRRATLAFVEVKARASHDAALEAVSPFAARRIVAAAGWWCSVHPASAACDCRFDIVTVSPYLFARHLPNAFAADSF